MCSHSFGLSQTGALFGFNFFFWVGGGGVFSFFLSKIVSSVFRLCQVNNINKGFPGASNGKESTCNVGDLGWIPGLGRSPGERHGNSLQYSCLENLHGQRTLAGYSPRAHKESDMTEQQSTRRQ